MSPSNGDARERFALQASVKSPQATLTVLDGFDNVCKESEGPVIRLDLPKGLYTVRARSVGRMTETVVRLDRSQKIELEPPHHFTAAPLAGADSSHEYYSYPARDQSLRQTAPDMDIDGPPAGRLFVFVRAVDQEHYGGEDLSAGLSIAGTDGKHLETFNDPGTVASDRRDGWMAFSVRISPGGYILRYDGQPRCSVAVEVLAGWQTQVFIFHDGNAPKFDAMRVFMAPVDQGFYTDDEIARALDNGIDRLTHNYGLLSRRDMNLFLGGKFKNPLLGIIALHLLLKRWPLNRDLIDTVFRNLDYLVPDSMDLRILKNGLALQVGDPLPESPPFTFPPMLAAGTSMLIDAAAMHPDKVRIEGLANRIVTRLKGEAAFTSWEPLPRVTKPPRDFRVALRKLPWREGLKAVTHLVGVRESADPDLRNQELILNVENLLGKAVNSEKVAAWIESDDTLDLDWVQEGLLDVVENIIKSRQEPSLAQLTAAMRLPKNTVKQAFIDLVKAAPAISEALRKEWPRAFEHIDNWLVKYPALDDAVQFLTNEQDWVDPALVSGEGEIT